jgi:uncharacterized protein YndB with AHSA1/START domain
VIAPLLTAVLLSAAPGAGTREIVFDITVDEPPAAVFQLWASAPGILKFFAPKATVEPRVGGRYQLAFEPQSDPEGRQHGTFGVSILELVPERRLVAEWSFPPFGPEYATKPYPTRLEIDIEPAPENRTRVRLAHRGFPTDTKWDKPLTTFRDVIWPLVLNRLVVYARDGVSPTWDDPKAEPLSRVVHKDVLVNASGAEVWKSWTTSAGIKAFLGADSRIEAVVGGPFELYFNPAAPAGDRGSEGCRFLAVEPERRVTFEWNAPPHLPTIRPQHHVVTLAFEPEATATRVRLDAIGYGAGPEWAKTQEYFDKAWGSVLGALAKRFAAPTKD